MEALRKLTGNDLAEFRVGQREAIAALVEDKSRVIVVQRTGWGKSAVYFVATHLLRNEGFGPSLIISPLLALMNNQITAATSLGLRAYTINSANDLEVGQLVELLRSDSVDVLLISPERLANPEFATKVIPLIGSRRGLMVIDEVHCISDWGHDFRPDYRRLSQVINILPPGIPILGTTATADDRVVDDVATQLGKGLPVIRGPLKREGLALSVLDMPDRASRLAWLDKNLASLPGTGIIYCLTQRDVDVVAGFLTTRGHRVTRYRSGGGIEQAEKDEALERLLANDVKALVASSALGMGYDKPDVAFVVHFQSTDSLVGYYQQVGRAGRAIASSVGIMMRGSEDSEIHDYFMKGTFPKESEVNAILAAFDESDGPMTTNSLERHVNLRQSRIESTLKQLYVEGVVDRVSAKTYSRTLKAWVYPHDRIAQTIAAKQRSRNEVSEYFETSGCRMRFIVNRLNDDDDLSCGLCDNCRGESTPLNIGSEDVNHALTYLRRGYLVIEPRRRNWDGRHIPPNELLEEGRCLSKWKDGGAGDLVARGKQAEKHFSDDLVDRVVEMIAEWNPPIRATWVTCVPSTRSGDLVPNFASRLATRLALPFVSVVTKARATDPQKGQENSVHQGGNVSGAFAITGAPPAGPVLLVDDLVDSRWTLTEIGRLLRRSGSGPVLPLALASTQSGDS